MSYKREIKMCQYTPSRDAYMLRACEGKSVLHIGACDWPYTKEKFATKTLLYAKIDMVAYRQLGVDNNDAMVKFLNAQDFTVSKMQCVDMNAMQDINFVPDIIIFGETLEHLMNLEIALQTVRNHMTKETELIISVPNAMHFLSFFYAILGYEAQHPDHKVAFTYKTITQLLRANNLDILEVKFTWLTDSIATLNWKGKIAFYISRPFSRLFPLFSGNILVRVRR